MIKRIQILLPVLVALFSIHSLRASTIFPIATNSGVVNLNGTAATCGSNYLVSFIAGNETAFQLISTNGALIGSEATLGFSSELPKVSFAGADYLVLWYDVLATNWQAQIVSPTGTLLGSALSFGLAQSNGASVLLTDKANYLVAWETNNNGPYYGQFINSVGLRSGSPFMIASNNANLAGAYGATNYLFIWQATNKLSPNLSLYGSFVSKSGSVGAPFQISQSLSLDAAQPVVHFDGTNFFVLWESDASRNGNGAPIWNLLGTLVTQAGTLASPELLLTANNPLFPNLGFDGTNYLVSWSHDVDTGNSDIQLVFQFFNRSGAPVGPEFTPFSDIGASGKPLYGGAAFANGKYSAICTVGADSVLADGTIKSFTSGAVYGSFLSPMPPLAGSNYIAGQFSGTLYGSPGFSYAIQYATNLAATNWTSLVTNTGTFGFTDPGATNQTRFYRAVQQ